MQETTPLMKQYHEIKQKFSDTLVLFQVGDFYELFFEDAKKAAAFLGITLTKRGKNNGEPIPLCGVPVHALDHYLNKLVRGGFKVALCDQLEQARPGKVVERGVTRVFTPGTLTDTSLLDEKNASYIFSFFPLPHAWGLLFAELLTAQLHATIVPSTEQKALETELMRFFPDEILLPATAEGKSHQSYFKQMGYFTSFVDFNQHNQQELTNADRWLQQFKAESHIAYAHQSVRMALYHFYAYIRITHEASLHQFNSINLYQPSDYMLLDPATQRNLEIVKNNHDATRSSTLFAVMDGAQTPMGSRMIKKWLLRPLIEHEAIMQRHEVVQLIMNNVVLMQQLKELLRAIGDCERIIGRIALRKAHLNDYLGLMHMLSVVPSIVMILQQAKESSLIRTIIAHCVDFSALHYLLSQALNDDSSKEWIIKKGFDAKLDQMRELVESAHRKILELEQREQQATGIGSLKIRYNQVHGFAIEITKTHYAAVPAHYIRRQTLVGRERFTTPELQQLEYDIAQARTDIVGTENAVFEGVKQRVYSHITALRKMAHALAHLDALVGFAAIAYDYGYVRPTMLSDNRDIRIIQGRHPVVERTLEHAFIANDTMLTDDQSLWVITGPNMGGKSTYLRQVALLSIMAQCGSFIPAQQADLPLLDRIFTRIGSGDNLAAGKSTFMVEMEETAAICTQATRQSLVILDEVGRGTSTFDGLALAQAVVEYIYTAVGARCLFATHYHELTQLSGTTPGIANYHAASTKTAQGISFLYKILPGVADGSFGLQVAQLALLPPAIIERAQSLVQVMEQKTAAMSHIQVQKRPSRVADTAMAQKLAYFEQAFSMLATLDCESLTPKQAFDLIWQLKENQKLLDRP